MLLKRALLITYYFPPSAASGSFRLHGFARHLPAAGWQPLVVAPPSMPWEPSDPQLANDLPLEAIVHPVEYPTDAPKILRYFAQYAVWLPRAWAGCRRVIEEYRPEVILTSGPPHCIHILGHYLKQKTGLPWVADFRDPWISNGQPRKLRWLDRWFLKWERRVFRNADLILANAPNAQAMLQHAYPGAGAKIVTLTNGFDPRPLGQPTPSMVQDSCLRLLHAGELYAGRNPLPLLEALARSNDERDGGQSCELHILGRNDPSGIDFPQVLKERGWSDFVHLHGQQAYQDTLDAMERADILVLFDSPGRKIGVPAKLYEYLGAGRPILALAEADGDTAAVLRSSGILHRVAPPNDTTRIERALHELRREMLTSKPVPDPSLLNQFTRERLALSLGNIFDALTEPLRAEAKQESMAILSKKPVQGRGGSTPR